MEHAIREMLRRIVRQFHPERVIPFGSHAPGEAAADSDVNVLVVMPVKGLKHEQLAEPQVALRDVGVPKNILISRTEEFAWRKEVVGAIRYPAVRRGRPLCFWAGKRRLKSTCHRRRCELD
ncbi:MAG: nucleotidyltransferase domain-containing protein [Bryobacteraceae bacterium]|nr:nucleotidyltransferase domain-containing protein [Bryobacteraceae bacterium]